MRRPVTDISLLAYIARKKADSISYTEATKACRSSSSASRALHQLIREGLIETRPRLLGLRYVTQYVITPKGKQASSLALQLSELREVASKGSARQEKPEEARPEHAEERTKSSAGRKTKPEKKVQA